MSAFQKHLGHFFLLTAIINISHCPPLPCHRPSSSLCRDRYRVRGGAWRALLIGETSCRHITDRDGVDVRSFVVGDALSVRGEARGVTRTMNLSAWCKQTHLTIEIVPVSIPDVLELPCLLPKQASSARRFIQTFNGISSPTREVRLHCGVGEVTRWRFWSAA